MQASYLWRADAIELLGAGGRLFTEMMAFLFFGVYLVVPLSSFALITSEKERNSLQLLLITRLGPWTIVLEKLLSQMVPAWLFLLTSLPILSVAYSMGGVSGPMLSSAVWVLSLTALHCACVALMCSAWARTSVQAFMLTIGVGLFMVLGPLWLFLMLDLHGPAEVRVALCLCGPFLFFEYGERSFTSCLLASIPLVIASAGCLTMARVFLTRRALATKGLSDRVKEAFSESDAARSFVESPIGRATIRRTLPAFAPIAWRESGRPGSTLRVGLLLLAAARCF